MVDANANKLKSLKESLKIREKELLAVFKELDHYRRKCQKLKLLLLKQKSENPQKQEPKTEKKRKLFDSFENTQKKEPEIIPSKEDGEILETSKPQSLPVKRKRKSQVTKFMETITSKPENNSTKDFPILQNPVKEDPSEIDENVLSIIQKTITPAKPVSKAKPNVNQPKAVYNKPYSISSSYTEINYSNLTNKPAKYTPMTLSLSQLSPLTTKFKEFFELIKKHYCSNYEFNLVNLSLLADMLKDLDPQSAASYFVNEMVQCSYLFSPQDALSIIYGVIKEIVGNQS